MEKFASFTISRINLLISKEQYKIDNPFTQLGHWPIPAPELQNRIKGMTMVLKIIQENPTPGSGDHNAIFQGLVLATIRSLENKTDKSELCGILVGMAKAVSAYNSIRKEVAQLLSA